ncbi:MAG: FapA family protein [Kiritimatiellae bacterium]|nr:FapA family protein [Kiritimatiellia bacterium]
MAAEDKFPIHLVSDRYTLTLNLAADATKCLADLTCHDGNPLQPEELTVILQEQGVIEGLRQDAIQELCNQAAGGKEVVGKLVACGIPPVSTGGRVEFLVRQSIDRPELQIDENAQQADYRNTNMFENVYKDQPLATIYKASKQNGLTVTGRVIEVKPGREIFVHTGDGAKKTDNGRTIIATRDGRLVYEADKVSVSENLVVDFDVDYHVGHIDFVGAIRVGGDVKDGFNVSGKKSVQIDGTVGVCHVRSEGNIKLGGMAGAKKPEAIIECGGDLTANYLHGVTVECAGDIHVSYEMLHCTVNCKGAIFVHGNISGGAYAAANGIEVESVGSELGVVTRLKAGMEDKEISPMAKLEDELNLIIRDQQRIVKQLDPLRRNPKAIANSDRLKKLAADLLTEYQRLNTRKQEIEGEVQTARYEQLKRANDIKIRANAKINVIRKLYRGTIIELDGALEKTRTDNTGPISIIKNTTTETMCILPMTSITTNARDLEKTILSKNRDEN